MTILEAPTSYLGDNGTLGEAQDNDSRARQANWIALGRAPFDPGLTDRDPNSPDGRQRAKNAAWQSPYASPGQLFSQQYDAAQRLAPANNPYLSTLAAQAAHNASAQGVQGVIGGARGAVDASALMNLRAAGDLAPSLIAAQGGGPSVANANERMASSGYTQALARAAAGRGGPGTALRMSPQAALQQVGQAGMGRAEELAQARQQYGQGAASVLGAQLGTAQAANKVGGVGLDLQTAGLRGQQETARLQNIMSVDSVNADEQARKAYADLMQRQYQIGTSGGLNSIYGPSVAAAISNAQADQRVVGAGVQAVGSLLKVLL